LQRSHVSISLAFSRSTASASKCLWVCSIAKHNIWLEAAIRICYPFKMVYQRGKGSHSRCGPHNSISTDNQRPHPSMAESSSMYTRPRLSSWETVEISYVVCHLWSGGMWGVGCLVVADPSFPAGAPASSSASTFQGPALPPCIHHVTSLHMPANIADLCKPPPAWRGGEEG